MPHTFSYTQYASLKGLSDEDESKYQSEVDAMNKAGVSDNFGSFGKDVLSMYTVVDLKEELKANSLSTAGKKQDMIDRLEEFYGANKKRKAEDSEGSEKKQKTSSSMELDMEGKNPGNVIGGLKAAVHNDNVSDEAKERAQAALDDMGVDADEKAKPQKEVDPENLSNREAGGYKATLHNERTSDEAKERAQEILDKAGVDADEKRSSSGKADEEKDESHVIAGLKATLTNVASSDEARESARKRLEEMGVNPDERVTKSEGDKDESHVIAGLKAAMTNASTSDEAREAAKLKLQEMGVDPNERVTKTDEEKDQSHVVAGLKAALVNPNTSDEAQESARKRLEEIGADPEERLTRTKSDEEKDESHVIGGYKATLSNASSSEEAKAHALEKLKEMGVDPDERAKPESTHELTSDGKNLGNVIGGLKAAMHNDNVSDAAKEQVREQLVDLGVKTSQ